MVTVVDVRNLLNIPAAIIPDATIQSCIDVATALVEYHKVIEDVTLIDKATLVISAYYVVLSYTTYFERSVDEVSRAFLERLLQLWKLEYDRWLEMISRRMTTVELEEVRPRLDIPLTMSGEG